MPDRKQASFLVLIFLMLNAGCHSDKIADKTIVISAAASLANVLPEVVAAVKDSLGSFEVKYNFAGSSILARQITAGSPANVFLSADAFWMEKLAEKKMVDSRHVIALLSNKLVVVTPMQAAITFTQLDDLVDEDLKFIALADPEHVPAGKYAKASLEKAGLWDTIAHKVVSAQDVRAAMAFVEAGEADAGIVYATDAQMSRLVNVALKIPDTLQPKIRYVLAAIKPETEQSKLLVRLLQSQKAKEVFAKHGFEFIAKYP